MPIQDNQGVAPLPPLKGIIAVDLDDVLSSTNEYIARCSYLCSHRGGFSQTWSVRTGHNENYGSNLALNDFYYYYYWKVCPSLHSKRDLFI